MRPRLRVWPAALAAAAGLILVALPAPRAAELDEVESALRLGYDPALRWECLGDTRRVCGPPVRHDFRSGLDLLPLTPGQATVLRAPPAQALRFAGSGLEPDALCVEASDGSGLFARLPVVRSADGALLAFPQSRESFLVRVGSAGPDCPLGEVAVLVSRYQPLPDIAPYRGLIDFPGKPVSVRREDRPGPDDFWPAGPGCPIGVEVTGPVRLAVETRYRYLPGESRAAQFYRVHVRLGAERCRPLEYETDLEPRFVVFVDHQEELVSRAERAFLEVPAGTHTLIFDPTAPVYIRLLRQDVPDFLLPRLNQPTPTAPQARARHAAAVAALTPWDITPTAAAWIANAPPGATAEKERLALRMARDNRRREGGLAGAMLLTAAGAARVDYPRAAEVGQKLADLHTFYRDLYPLRKTTPDRQIVAYFLDPRLTRPGEWPYPPPAPAPLREDLFDRVASASFLTVPEGAESALMFPVPERFGPSLLRVLAWAGPGGPGEFFVQFDREAPTRLSGGPMEREEEYVPTRGEMALAAVVGVGPAATLEVPFTRTRLPGPLAKVGTAELPLPAGVREVRVWSAAPPPPGLRVAVQYRTGRPYQLSEGEFLDQLRRATSDGPAAWSAYLAFWKGEPLPVPPGADQDAVRELANQYVPLVRLMHARSEQFRATVVPSPWSTPPQTDVTGAVLAAANAVRARAFAAHKDWTPAVEAWTAVLRTATGPLRREALFGRADALSAGGEDFLAELQLRGIFLDDPDPAARAEALARLDRRYRDAADDEAVETLRATAALREPTPANLRSLAEALVDRGEYEAGLLAALVPANPERPRRTIRRAAYQLRWWRLFEKAAEGAPEGDPPERVQAALAVREGLRSADPDARGRVVVAWERWQAAAPGPLRWQPEPALAADFAAAANVYAVDRDLYAAFFLATPDRPVRVRAAGPVRLRFEVRPLHPAGPAEPIDDWLRISRPGRLRLVPVNNNFPSQGLTIAGMPDRVPGVKLDPMPEIELGPGLQEVELSAESRPVLVRVYARRPEVPSGVLPPLTPESVALSVAGGDEAQAWEFVDRNRPPAPPDAVLLAERLTASRELRAALDATPATSPESALRRMALLLRLAETDPRQRMFAVAEGEALFAAFPAAPGLEDAHSRLVRNIAWEPIPAVQASAGVRQFDVAGWAPEGPVLRTRTALLRPVGAGEQLVYASDRLVLSLINKMPTVLRVGFRVEDVAHVPPLPGAAYYQVDDGRVQRVPLPVGATEVREVPVPGGLHGVRFWLEGPPIANRFLRVDVTERPANEPVVRLTRRAYQLATPKQPVRLTVEGPAWIRIDQRLPDGSARSEYRLVTKDREVLELAPPAGQDEALFRLFRRVAVPEEPPARPRPVVLTTRPVPPPLATAPPPPLLPPPDRGAATTPGAGPAPQPPGSGLFVEDAYRLGTQEDGTWSATGGYWRRMPLTEDLRQLQPLLPGVKGSQKGYDTFTEGRVTNRYFDEWHNLYYQTNVLARVRNGGNPTVGLLEHVRYDPDGVPYVFHLDAQLYAQDYPDARALGYGPIRWSGYLEGRVAQVIEVTPKLRNIPSAMVFGRVLNTDAHSPFQGLLDQDVFTHYKATHHAGWELSDTARYWPWLDTLLQARAGLTSNENFWTLDNLRLEGSVTQWVTDVEATAGYRMIQFFPGYARPQSVVRHVLGLGFLRDFWVRDRDRVQLAANWEYEFTQKVYSFNASLTWYFGGNRRYHDFRPDELLFRDLRERRASERLANNRAWQDW